MDASSGTVTSAVPTSSTHEAQCLVVTVVGGSQFMINELGMGHLSLYGPMVTDHCVAAGCPVTQTSSGPEA